MQNFVELYVWTINALLTVHSEMLPFQEITKNIKMLFGVPPEHFAIGYVHNDNLLLGNIAYNSLFQTISGWSDGVFFLMISFTFWRSRK